MDEVFADIMKQDENSNRLIF
ncbi:hypothetical protein B14911_14052 [Bacillus sp. NRRL B-14911]|nr:hypothetical protein B14911_14052 [Bacillus sp. NRRL B-14911]